ncbi:hypothetical protein L218DRAFT_1010653 [Marasmius fiardii PR-910]|nr:hypothetical protein L218DRAFT_1010653 [Marasmius fiardii PR-910]
MSLGASLIHLFNINSIFRVPIRIRSQQNNLARLPTAHHSSRHDAVHAQAVFIGWHVAVLHFQLNADDKKEGETRRIHTQSWVSTSTKGREEVRLEAERQRPKQKAAEEAELRKKMKQKEDMVRRGRQAATQGVFHMKRDLLAKIRSHFRYEGLFAGRKRKCRANLESTDENGLRQPSDPVPIQSPSNRPRLENYTNAPTVPNVLPQAISLNAPNFNFPNMNNAFNWQHHT